MAIQIETAPEIIPAAQQTAVDETQAQADFDAGAAMESSAAKPATEQPRDDTGRFVPAKPVAEPIDKATPTPAAKPVEDAKPKYIQLTQEQFDRLEAAAKRTDDIEGKFSKAFGTIGDVQKIVKTLQGQTPRGAAVKIPDGAFAAMEKDFPELAKHTRSALEATLKGMEGTGSSSAQIDTAEFDKKIEQGVTRLQFEELDDAYPDWRQIVGAVDTSKGEKPDPNNAFRKWLATKDKAYQDRINLTNSAGVITRAIVKFKSETKAPTAPAPKPSTQAAAQTNRIQEGLRPRGDGGQPPVKDADDEFQAGFKTG